MFPVAAIGPIIKGAGKVADRAKSDMAATVGGVTGIIEGIQAIRAKRKANSEFPGLIDPQQAAFLSEMNQKRKALDTGAEYTAGMDAANEGNASVNDAIIKSTGGDTGSTIQSLLQSERVMGQNQNNVLAQSQNAQKFFTGVSADMLNRIAGRKMQLELAKSSQDRAEWAQKSQDATANILNAVGRMGPGKNIPAGGGGTPPPANASAGIDWAHLLNNSNAPALPEQPTQTPVDQTVATPSVTGELPTTGSSIDLSSMLSSFK